MRHAVLEVVRNEWSTNASNRKQKRSNPAVTVGSEGLMDDRHQCFEVSLMRADQTFWHVGSWFAGTPMPLVYANSPVILICCVERWKFIRRFDGYTDSTVYQSVVLNVGRLFTGASVRRYAYSPVYADSPVCQSVGLGVGSLYAGTPICRYSNMLCWNVGNFYFAGTPIRRHTDLLIWNVGNSLCETID